MDDFEKLLSENMGAVDRFVKFRLPSQTDAEDVLQETYLAAYRNFDTLQDVSIFKAWLIGIARHKCNDYYRRRAKMTEIPIENESAFGYGRMGITETNIVRATLFTLADQDREMLELYYFREMPQAEIAKRLQIPIGTVKSRLYNAKARFKENYPYPPETERINTMKNLPEMLPEYKIVPSDMEPFEVVWEELMGWFLVPKLGEKLLWGMYDMPDGKLGEMDEMEVVGQAEVHGLEGVEITVKTKNPMPCNAEEGDTDVDRRFVAQLTDTHCRYLAESHQSNGINHYYTFLDGDAFLKNWGFGENNCGNETHLSVKGDIVRKGEVVRCKDKSFLLDIVGRYSVTIGGKTYDTVCVMDIGTYEPGMVCESYLDRNGRTVLWRRFNRDDWAFDKYQKKWSEKLPDSERLIVNDEVYVHWYDCITDYIL